MEIKLTSIRDRLFLLMNLKKDIDWFTAEIAKLQEQKSLLVAREEKHRKALTDALFCSGKSVIETDIADVRGETYPTVEIEDEKALIDYFNLHKKEYGQFVQTTETIKKSELNFYIKNHLDPRIPGVQVVNKRKIVVTKPGATTDFSGAKF